MVLPLFKTKITFDKKGEPKRVPVEVFEKIKIKQFSSFEEILAHFPLPYKLEQELPFDFQYYLDCDNNHSYFGFRCHHLLLDGTSQGIVFDHLLSSYAGSKSPLRWSRDFVLPEKISAELGFFSKLSRFYKLLKLTKPEARSLFVKAYPKYQLKYQHLHFEQEELEHILDSLKKQKTTLFKQVSHILMRALHQETSNQAIKPIVFAIPLDLRKEIRELSYLGNMVAIERLHFEGNENLEEFSKILDEKLNSRVRLNLLLDLLSLSSFLPFPKLKKISEKLISGEGKKTSTLLLSFMNMKNIQMGKLLPILGIYPLSSTFKTPGITLNMIQGENFLHLSFSYIQDEINGEALANILHTLRTQLRSLN